MGKKRNELSDALLRGRLGLGLCVLVHVAVAVASFADDRFLNDEGLLTHTFATAMGHAPWPALFLLKTRPPISLLYAPFSALGLEAFWAAHVVVAALAIPLWAAVARALGHHAPIFTAAVVGLSPLMIAGGAAGVSNTDAVTAIGLFAWLWVAKERPFGAALVLGVLPLMRAELSVLVLLVVGAQLWQRRFAVVGGVLAIPVAYAIAGAVYHADPIWFLHWPPALTEPMPGNPYWDGRAAVPSVGHLVATALALTPVLGVAGLARWRDLSGFERIGVWFVTIFVLALVVLPSMRVFNFDHAPRYLLPIVPFVGLVVGRVVGRWLREGEAARRGHETVLLLGLLGVAIWAERTGASGAGLAAVALWSGALALARTGRTAIASITVAATIGLSPFVFADGGRVDRFTQAPHLDEIVEHLRDDRARLSDRTVYTNEPLLAVYLARSGGLRSTPVRYIVQADQLHELTRLTNPDNGQREAIRSALRHGAYGDPVFPEDLDPDAIPAGAVFVLTDDRRLDLVMPPEVWTPRLRVVHPGYGATISELTMEER